MRWLVCFARNSGCLFPVIGSLIRDVPGSSSSLRAQWNSFFVAPDVVRCARAFNPNAGQLNFGLGVFPCILKTNLSGSYSTRGHRKKRPCRINRRKDRHKPLDAPYRRVSARDSGSVLEEGDHQGAVTKRRNHPAVRHPEPAGTAAESLPPLVCVAFARNVTFSVCVIGTTHEERLPGAAKQSIECSC